MSPSQTPEPAKTPTSPSGPVEPDARRRGTEPDAQADTQADAPDERGAQPDAGKTGDKDRQDPSRAGERPIADVDRKVRPGDA